MTTRVVGRVPAPLPGQAPAAPPDKAEQLDVAIRHAIEQRDLKAFLRLMPADDVRRRKVLHDSLAMDFALTNAAAAIVQQILRWQPDAMHERWANSNTLDLEQLDGTWDSLKWAADHHLPTDNLAKEADLLYVLRLLLEAGANPDGALDWRPPLGIIASQKQDDTTIAAAKLLLKAGANVNAPRPDTQPPLVIAAEASNEVLVALMLATGRATQDTLDHAIAKTSVTASNPVLVELLKGGANINSTVSPNGTPGELLSAMETAAEQYRSTGDRSLLELMIRYRADPNRMRVADRDSPLMRVVPEVPLMRALLELGAQPNHQNREGESALLRAVKVQPAGADPNDLSDPRIVATALLLEHGANPSVVDQEGLSPLKAARGDDAAMVGMLMKAGATWALTDRDVEYYRSWKASVDRLTWAILQRKDALAAGMLAHQEPLAAADCGAAYHAAAMGAAPILKTLLDLPGHLERVRDKLGRTPLMAAAIHGQLGAIRVLLEHPGVEVDQRTPRRIQFDSYMGIPGVARVGGATALMFAADSNQAEAIDLLLKLGADPEAHDFAGDSALVHAQQHRAQAAVTALLAHGAT